MPEDWAAARKPLPAIAAGIMENELLIRLRLVLLEGYFRIIFFVNVKKNET